MLSRRRFVGALAATAAIPAAELRAPLGLYLDIAGGDLLRVFEEVASRGYREIEIAGLRDRRPSELRKLLDQAGLSCKSACWPMWENDADSQETIDAAVELGLDYLVTPSPLRMGKEWFETSPRPMTVNDWRWVADWFNHVGGLAQKNDVQFVYRVGAEPGFQELWSRTEPTRVTFELDCAAVDPLAFLKDYSSRTVLAHVRDPHQWPLPVANGIRYVYVVTSRR